MININGSKFPEDIFKKIDQIYEESNIICKGLPKEALDLIDKNRTSNTATVTKGESPNSNKPKI